MGASDLTDANPVEAEHVANQLRRNYPEKALGWVKDARWIGPVQIPQDRVDYADVDSWAASHQPVRIKHFAKKIRKGEGHLHPVVAVQEPGDDKVKVIDGHHRTLAYKRLGRPVKAYVGFVDHNGGPWDETHAHQYAKGADPANKASHPDTCKCLTCGCRQESATHGNPANITIEDLQAAARAAGISLMQAWSNMQHTIGHAEPATAAEKAAFLAALAGSSDRLLADSAAEELRKVDEGEVGDIRARHLMDYWAHGEGAAKIGWGTPNDYDRCLVELGKHVGPGMVHGLCANLHHKALGIWPATHAAAERHAEGRK